MARAEHDSEIVPLLLHAIKKGRLVLFIGAGASAEAGLPNWQELIDQLLTVFDEAGIYDAGVVRAYKKSARLSTTDALEVLDTLLEQQRARLQSKFTSIFPSNADSYPSTRVAKLLASIGAGRFATLNYDYCFERAAREVGKVLGGAMCFPVFDSERFENDPEPFLVHIHGDAGSGIERVVLTQKQYNHAYDGGSDLTNLLKRMFQDWTVLFVGFGFHDYEVKQILSNNSDFAKGPDAPYHVAILPKKLRGKDHVVMKDRAFSHWNTRTLFYDLADKDTKDRHKNLVQKLEDLRRSLTEPEPVTEDSTRMGVSNVA